MSVSESDLINGIFENKEITEISDNCFYEMPSLIKVILPKVKKIGNDCFRSNDKLTTVTLPALTTAGNYCFRSNDKLTTVTLKKVELSVKNVDGYCFVIEKSKPTKGIKIHTGYNFLSMKKGIIEKDLCFVAEKGKFYAHGETPKKAIGDMQFKIVAEKLKNDPIKPDTEFTVKYYRLLTGACDFGCRSFMDANKIPYTVIDGNTVEKKPIKAKDLLPILQKNNAYGLEKFKQLITF